MDKQVKTIIKQRKNVLKSIGKFCDQSSANVKDLINEFDSYIKYSKYSDLKSGKLHQYTTLNYPEDQDAIKSTEKEKT